MSQYEVAGDHQATKANGLASNSESTLKEDASAPHKSVELSSHPGVTKLLEQLRDHAERSSSKTTIEVYTPSSPQYLALCNPFNRRLSQSSTPGVILYPTTADEISTIVKAAGANGLPVVARSGGHSYAGFSCGVTKNAMQVTEPNDVVVIDMKAFNAVKFEDEIGEVVTIGGGCQLGRISEELYVKGRAIPHGVCPGVGLGGHALHGGYGPISRNWGLITDRILSIQVILADGSLVTTSDQENIDLFWALRGAGSSYGIATSFTFRTYPAPKSNILFELKWPVVTPKIAAAVLMEYQAWLPTIPSELGIAYMLWPGEDKKHTMILEFSGHFVGSTQQWHQVLDPFLSHLRDKFKHQSDPPFGLPVKQLLRECDWPTMLAWLGEDTGTLDTFYAKSLYIAEPITEDHASRNCVGNDEQVDRGGLSLEAAERFTDYLANVGCSEKTDGLYWFVMADAWGGKHSAINSVPSSAMAFSARTNLYSWQLYVRSEDRITPFTTKGMRFADGMWNTLVGLPENEKCGSPEIMKIRRKGVLNYVDSEFNREEAHKMYYSEENLKKLKMLKRQYDPNNVFRYPHSIVG